MNWTDLTPAPARRPPRAQPLRYRLPGVSTKLAHEPAHRRLLVRGPPPRGPFRLPGGILLAPAPAALRVRAVRHVLRDGHPPAGAVPRDRGRQRRVVGVGPGPPADGRVEHLHPLVAAPVRRPAGHADRDGRPEAPVVVARR